MFNPLEKLTISGGGFPADQYPKGVTLDLFKYRLNLIYGKNGSGKSTIASAIMDWKEGVENDVRISFSPALPNEAGESVYVFNEDFIRKNVLERQRGPQTIMMIGSENVTATQRIEELEEEIKKLKASTAPLRARIAELEDKKNPSSMEAALNAVLAILKAGGGYAERATLVKNCITSLGGKNKSRVGEATIDAILATATSNNDPNLPGNAAGLEKYLNSKLTMLCSAAGGQSKIWWPAPQVCTGIDPDEVNALLSRQVIKPELNDREKAIFSLLDDSSVSVYLRQTRKDIIDAEASFCPLCHQQVEPEVRESLLERVTRLLGNEESSFVADLDHAILSITPVNFTMPAFPEDMYKSDLDACGNSLRKLGAIVDDVTAALEARHQDLYRAGAYRLDAGELSAAVKDVGDAIGKLSYDVNEYNRLIDDKAALQAEAEKVNCMLAYMEAKKQIDGFLKLREEYADAVSKVDSANEDINKRRAEINELGLQMKQTATAHDYINAQLANIFYSKNRLSLKGSSDDGSYILCSHGKPVRPGNLSTGERNIIALAYFFATLFSGKSDSNRYSEPMLVVIDDPVSSFDSGNRAGISAFLSFEIGKILQGNMDDSKVLVLSHDIYTVNDLSKMSYVNGDDAPCFREMRDGRLFNIQSRDNEYWRLLCDIFEYAAGDKVSESEEMAIGNKMRRVLETYSTFMYQCGFKDMLDPRHEYVCKTLPEDKRDYYRSFLGRFILDASSHSNNQVNTLDFTESLYSHEEKLANARNLLTFMYWSNPTHLRAYLQNKKKDMFSTVEHWATQQDQGL